MNISHAQMFVYANLILLYCTQKFLRYISLRLIYVEMLESFENLEFGKNKIDCFDVMSFLTNFSRVVDERNK